MRVATIVLPGGVVPFPGIELDVPARASVARSCASALARNAGVVLGVEGRKVQVEAQVLSIESRDGEVRVWLLPTSRLDPTTGKRWEPDSSKVTESVEEVLRLAYSRFPQIVSATPRPTAALDALAAGGPFTFATRLRVLSATTADRQARAMLPMLRRLGNASSGRWSRSKGRSSLAELAQAVVAAAIRGGANPGMVAPVLDQIVLRAGRDSLGTYESALRFAASLPWELHGWVPPAVAAVRAELEARHYGHPEVKSRLVEEASVLARAHALGRPSPSTVLCLVGPPGVGKTTLVAAFARALDLPFARIACGAVTDAFTLAGLSIEWRHPTPGAILKAISIARSRRCILLLDELDKLGGSANTVHGNPAAVLLAALDPAQNREWMDAYVQVPFDLSQVIWVASANDLSRIPNALADRTQVIEMRGYTLEEKRCLLRSHILPSLMSEYPIKAGEVIVPGDLMHLIANRDHSPGARGMRRQMEAALRRAVVRLYDGDRRVVLTAQDLVDPAASLARPPIGFQLSAEQVLP